MFLYQKQKWVLSEFTKAILPAPRADSFRISMVLYEAAMRHGNASIPSGSIPSMGKAAEKLSTLLPVPNFSEKEGRFSLFPVLHDSSSREFLTVEYANEILANVVFRAGAL
jgi:hypothetical protein